MIFYTLILVTWSFLFIEIVGKEVCFKDLECFPTDKPWSSLTRPVPAPQGPDKVKVNYQLYTRQNPVEAYYIIGESEWNLSGTYFDNRKTTYVVAHGYHGTADDQLEGVAPALLEYEDANVFLVDYGSIKDDAYHVAVSNARVAGALLAKFLRCLIEIEGTPVQSLHMVGMSLGAHVIAYAAKRVPGIRRLTGLDPAQPLFEGQSPEVRLDKGDAQFVEAIHTNGRPIVPFGGLGFNSPVGHNDYYFNGGWDQPGCKSSDVAEEMFRSGNFNLLEVWPRRLLCPHSRSKIYFIEAYLNRNCTFWGVKRQGSSIFLGYLSHKWLNQHNAFLANCTLDTCSPVGPRAMYFPARGSFDIVTMETPPYCLKHEDVDVSMDRQLLNQT